MQCSPLTPEQSRAGRALLGWTQDELAVAASVAKRTIADFESGRRSTYDRTLRDMREAMERAGVAFMGDQEAVDGGPGVRLQKGNEG